MTDKTSSSRELPVLFKSEKDGVIYKHSQILFLDKHPRLKVPEYMPSRSARLERIKERSRKKSTSISRPRIRRKTRLVNHEILFHAPPKQKSGRTKAGIQRESSRRGRGKSAKRGEMREKFESSIVKDGKFILGNPLIEISDGAHILADPELAEKLYPRPEYDGVLAQPWEEDIKWESREPWNTTKNRNSSLLPEIEENDSNSDLEEDGKEQKGASQVAVPGPSAQAIGTGGGLASFGQRGGDRGNSFSFTSPTISLTPNPTSSSSDIPALESFGATNTHNLYHQRSKLQMEWARRWRPRKTASNAGFGEGGSKLVSKKRLQIASYAAARDLEFKRKQRKALEQKRRNKQTPMPDLKSNAGTNGSGCWGLVDRSKAEEIVKAWVQTWDTDTRTRVGDDFESYAMRLKKREKTNSMHIMSGRSDVVSPPFDAVPRGTPQQLEALRTYLRYQLSTRKRLPGEPLLTALLPPPPTPKRYLSMDTDEDSDSEPKMTLTVTDLVEICSFGLKGVAERLRAKMDEKDELSQSEINRRNAMRYLSNPNFTVQETKKSKWKERKPSGSKDTVAQGLTDKERRDRILALRRVGDVGKEYWMDTIIWDDTRGAERPPLTQLLLDMNDLNMIFEEDLPINQEDDTEEGVGDVIARSFLTAPKETVEKDSDNEEEENDEDNDNSGLPHEQPPKNLDPFNLSNDYTDKYRQRLDEKKVVREVAVTHSRPAKMLYQPWFRYKLSLRELLRLHRPKISEKGPFLVPANSRMPIIIGEKAGPPDDKRLKWVKKAKQLSASEGCLALFEYIEQNPPILGNTGMCSLITTYHRKRSVEEELKPPTRDLGRAQILNVKDDSPLELGNIEPGKPVQCIVNKMYMAPIFKQRMDRTPNSQNLFLLVYRPSKGAWVIRRLPPTYTVGQTQPKEEVLEPYTKKAQELMKKRVKVYARRELAADPAKDLKKFSSEVDHLFASKLERNVRLDKVVTEERNRLQPGEQPNENILEELCPPESVCLYQSMAAGYERLIRVGIPEVLAPSIHSGRKCTVEKFVEFVKKLKKTPRITIVGGSEGKKHQPKPPPPLTSEGVFEAVNVAEFIRQEIELMPWNLTKSFRLFASDRKQLDKDGVGNPLKSGQGVSYTIDFTDGKAQDEQDENEEEREGKALIRRNTEGGVTGKENDLRSLSMQEMAGLLEELQVSAEVIATLSRWDRVNKIRSLALQKVMNRQDLARWAKYARVEEKSSSKRMEFHKQEVRRIFKEQCQILARGGDTKDEPDLVKPRENSLLDQKLKISSYKSGLRDGDEEDDDSSEDEDQQEGQGGEAVMQGFSGEGKVKVDAIKETRWWYDHEADEWKMEIVIIKEQRYVREFKKDLRDGADRLRSLCEADREIGKAPPCYFDWSSSSQLHSARGGRGGGVYQNKRCGRCGQLGHTRQSKTCPDFPGSSGILRRRMTPNLNFTGSSTLTINMKAIKREKQRANAEAKRRKAESEAKRKAAAEAIRNSQRKKPPARHRGDPFIRMATALDHIMKTIKSKFSRDQRVAVFEKPVDTKIWKDYTEKVKTPMDLSTIQSKITGRKYHSRQGFLRDISLIYQNSSTYNGEQNPFTTAAQQIVNQARDQLEKDSKNFDDVEEDIKRYRMKNGMLEVIKVMKDHYLSDFFREPVSKKTFPHYYKKVANPMDLSTLEKHVKAFRYRTPEDFWKEAAMIQSNSAMFNGPTHSVTLKAKGLLEAGREASKQLIEHLPIPAPRQPTMKRKRKRTGKGSTPRVRLRTGGKTPGSVRSRGGIPASPARLPSVSGPTQPAGGSDSPIDIL
ncbi:hypothetical protein AAMO2058_001400900 [Amorphochlora amoebiformis]